ncbi:MAG: ArdC-like ssDNA-binding domain-containing protein [Bacteroidota bacterium]
MDNTAVEKDTNVTTKANQPKRDLYREVTDKIMGLLEKGVAPWRQTWSSYGLARNYVTGRPYNGINKILLNNTVHPIPYFLSFKQVKALNGKVKKGAKAEMVLYFSVFYKDAYNKTVSEEQAKEMKAAGQEVKKRSSLRYFSVFNIADVEGIEFHTPEVQLKENEQIEKCENIIKDMPNCPKIKHINGNEAYYNALKDFINMPKIKQFDSSAEYYVTLFHELTHATGHQDRLNRKGITEPTKFGSIPYSKEELIVRHVGVIIYLIF